MSSYGSFLKERLSYSIKKKIVDVLLGEHIGKVVDGNTVRYTQMDPEDDGAEKVIKYGRKKAIIHKHEAGYKVTKYYKPATDTSSKWSSSSYKKSGASVGKTPVTFHPNLDDAVNHSNNWVNKVLTVQNKSQLANSVVRHNPYADQKQRFEVVHRLGSKRVDDGGKFQHLGDAKRTAEDWVKHNGHVSSEYEYNFGKKALGRKKDQ